MNQTKPNQSLEIELKIRFRTRTIRVTLVDVLRWLVPLLAIAVRVYRMLQEKRP